MRKTIHWIVLVTSLLVVLSCGTGGTGLLSSPTANSTIPTFESPSVNLPQGALTIPNLISSNDLLPAIYEAVRPGIVAIRVATRYGEGLGSGFVIDMQGHIITNYHVVEGEQSIEVDFPSGYKAYGSVLGTDLDSDLAVVRVDVPPSELHPLTLGDSSTLQVGQTVVAIGNPYGLSGSMTVGIISATGRTMDSQHLTESGTFYTAADLIQTDASINPGNSGGPLLNLNGEVIGVNRAIQTAGTSSSGEAINTGIGFAIASNIVKRVVPTLIANRTYQYPNLGITSLEELSLAEMEALGIDHMGGAYVIGVDQGGPASRAGLRGGTRQTSIYGLLSGGDLIIAVDGQPVNVFSDLLSYLINHKVPGDTVQLTVLRAGQEIAINVVLGSRN